MSNIQYAFIHRSKVPDRATLQASIDALGFDLRLHPEYTPFKDAGFLPFVLEGEEGPGFEIGYQESRELLTDDPKLRALAADRDYCIDMIWHGSMRDLACAMIVSYALAKDFGAVVSYEGEPPEPEDRLLAGANEALIEARRERVNPASAHSSPVALTGTKPWWKFW